MLEIILLPNPVRRPGARTECDRALDDRLGVVARHAKRAESEAWDRDAMRADGFHHAFHIFKIELPSEPQAHLLAAANVMSPPGLDLPRRRVARSRS